MKKGLLILGSIILVLIIIFGLNYIQNKQLSNEKILEILKPKIDSYCADLTKNVTDSGSPTCYIQKSLVVEEISLYDNNVGETYYKITKEKENYLVETRLSVIHGRNDRPGYLTLFFKLDEEGNLIEQIFP